MPKKLYIQLEPERLLIGILKKNCGKTYPLILPARRSLGVDWREVEGQKQNKKPVNFDQIQENKIFNLSSIYLKTKQFLKENKIKKANAIICCPMLVDLKKEQQYLLTLQLSLCFSKAEILIEKIIGENILKNEGNMSFISKKEIVNQLDFFKQLKPQRKNNTFFWLLSTSLIFILMAFTQFRLQDSEQKKQKQLQQKLNMAKRQNELILKQLKQVHEIQQKNKTLLNQKGKIEKKLKNQNNPENLLLSISEVIPNHCWIKNLKIENKKKQNNKQKNIQILGHSLQDKDVLTFVSKLSKNKKLKNLKIDQLKMEKITSKQISNSDQSKAYTFKITAMAS